MRLADLFEENLINIRQSNINIENGKMLPNQFPNKVNSFNCGQLKNLTSLENCPQEIVNDFQSWGSSITSLEHAPKIVNGYFNCANTKITSLEYAPLKCDAFNCYINKIISLQGIGRKYLKECETLILPDTIKSNILGLCLVNKLNIIDIENSNLDKSSPLYKAIEIVKKHLQTDGDECREELIQNGYKDYAKF